MTLVLYVPHQKNFLLDIDGIRVVGGENALNKCILAT
jgi:hypothetical protein